MSVADGARSLRVHRERDRVLLFHATLPVLADEALDRQGFDGPAWCDCRTLALSLGRPTVRRADASPSTPTPSRVLGIWLPVTALEAYLREAVLDEPHAPMYDSVRAHRLATRWAPVLAGWENVASSEAQDAGAKRLRLSLRHAALERFRLEDVDRVEDVSALEQRGVHGGPGNLPPCVAWPLCDATAWRLMGEG